MVDELGVSRHKRSYINHIIVVPRLMTYAWRKKLHKICNLVLEIPAGVKPFWPACENEPIILGQTLRFVACIALGNSKVPTDWWNWVGNCKACGRKRTATTGVFYANYVYSRECWEPCLGMWCGECYVPHPQDAFHRHVPSDESGFVWRKLEDEFRQLYARAGDHLVTTF